MIVPPDRGFSWCIMAMTFVVSFLLDGTIFVVSDLFDDLEKDWGLTKQETSFISATHLGTYFCLGPFASSFINMCGFRVVAMLGCVIAIAGVIIGSFAKNLTTLLLSYGSLLGAGCGMTYTSASLINSYYFDKYRPIAAGVVGSGFGMSILVFGPVNKVLVTKLGWRNTLRVNALMIAGVLFISSFFKPVRPTRIGEVTIRKPIRTVDSSSSDEQETKVFVEPEVGSKGSDTKLSATRNFMEAKSSKKSGIFKSWKTKVSGCCKYNVFGKRLSAFADGNFVLEMGPLDRKDIFYTGRLEHQQSVLEASKSEVEKMFTSKDASVVSQIMVKYQIHRLTIYFQRSLRWLIMRLRIAFYLLNINQEIPGNI